METTQQQERPDLSLFDERVLDDIPSNEDMEEDKGFSVDSKQDAQKAFRAMKALENKIEGLTDEMEEMIDEIKDFYEPRIERAEESIDFLKNQIRQFVRARDESLSLPSGKAYEQTRTKWKYADRDALIEWAEKHEPDLVQIEKKISKTDFKNAVKDRGLSDEEIPADRIDNTSIIVYTTD